MSFLVKNVLGKKPLVKNDIGILYLQNSGGNNGILYNGMDNVSACRAPCCLGMNKIENTLIGLY